MAGLIPRQKLAFGPFTLVSPLAPGECSSRLAAAIRRPGSSLTGSAGERHFRVAWRYPPAVVRVRNSFKPYLFGRLQGSDGGTLIRCHFTFHPLVAGLLMFVLCMGAVGAIKLHVWTFLLVPLVILFAGVAASWAERELLVDDVASTLNARPQPDDRMPRAVQRET